MWQAVENSPNGDFLLTFAIWAHAFFYIGPGMLVGLGHLWIAYRDEIKAKLHIGNKFHGHGYTGAHA